MDCVTTMQSNCEKLKLPFEVLIQGPSENRVVRSLIESDAEEKEICLKEQKEPDHATRSTISIYKPEMTEQHYEVLQSPGNHLKHVDNNLLTSSDEQSRTPSSTNEKNKLEDLETVLPKQIDPMFADSVMTEEQQQIGGGIGLKRQAHDAALNDGELQENELYASQPLLQKRNAVTDLLLTTDIEVKEAIQEGVEAASILKLGNIALDKIALNFDKLALSLPLKFEEGMLGATFGVEALKWPLLDAAWIGESFKLPVLLETAVLGEAFKLPLIFDAAVLGEALKLPVALEALKLPLDLSVLGETLKLPLDAAVLGEKLKFPVFLEAGILGEKLIEFKAKNKETLLAAVDLGKLKLDEWKDKVVGLVPLIAGAELAFAPIKFDDSFLGAVKDIAIPELSLAGLESLFVLDGGKHIAEFVGEKLLMAETLEKLKLDTFLGTTVSDIKDNILAFDAKVALNELVDKTKLAIDEGKLVMDCEWFEKVKR